MKRILGVIIALLLIIGIIYYNSYFSVRTFDIDGFVFTSDNVTNNLVNGKDSSSGKVDYSKIRYDQTLYTGRNKYFIGEKRKIAVNLDYPVVSKDNKTLLLLSDKGKLIDDKFDRTSMYANTLVSDNKLFNENDYERADNINYLFIELDNTIIINLSKIEIKVLNREYDIPVNSFISFSEESLRYYYMINNRYVYKEIGGLDDDANISIDKKKFTYIEFLEKLGLFVEEEEEVTIPTPTPTPTITPQEKPKQEEEVVVKEEKETEIENGEEVYVKPTVSFSNPVGNIYSFTGRLEINDPASRIVKYPTFEFYKGDTLVVRKTFVNSDTIELKGLFPDTDYNVEAYFHYKNEKNQEIKAKITSFNVSTKNISGLEKVKFNIDKITPFYNYAEFTNMGINNSANDEVLKGIKKVVLLIGNNKYQLPSSTISTMLKLEKQNYTTAKSLTSNTRYNVDVEFYDVSNNKLNVEYSDYSFKTTKQAPNGTLAVKSKDINKASLRFDITNKDEVAVSNMRIVVSDSTNKIIKDTRINSLNVDLDDLSPNEIYTVNLFGDYDLEDGLGIQKNKLIVEGKFTTDPITTLGYVRLNFENINTSTDTISASVKINDETNQKLRGLLTSLKISLKDDETDEIIKTFNITGEDFNKLVAGDSYDLRISGLNSNSSYIFENSSIARLGSKNYDIKTITNTGTVKTLKKDAEVRVINKLTTENMIDFDVRVYDKDGAIESDRVLLEARNKDGALIYYDELKINDSYKHLTFEKLNPVETYTFSYKVEEYNIGHSNSTFETDKTLLDDRIVTEVGLSGSVEIDSLLKQITSKNVFDIKNNRRWLSTGSRDPDSRKINTTDNIISLGAKNGYRVYSYYLPEYKGKYVTASFKIKYKDSRQSPVYLCNTTGNCTTKQVTGITTDWMTYTYTTQLNASNPYFSFNIREVDGYNETTTILIKDLQIEEGRSATSYVPYKEKDNYMGTFITNLTDKNEEIDEEDFYYYLRYYKNSKLIDTVKFDFNNERKVIDAISKHEIEPSADYNVKLSIRKKIVSTEDDGEEFRFYDLDNLNFTSDDEIRTIKTVQDFYAMHTSGFYLVAADLDFTDQTAAIGSDVNRFNGIIDFQGHKVIKTINRSNGARAGSYLFHTIGSNGLIKNMDFHVYMNGTGLNDWPFFCYYQYGTIENVNVVLEQGNNTGNTVTSLLVRNNYGTIKNFVVNCKDHFSTARYTGLLVYYNVGNLINGYLYGESINATYPNNAYKTPKYVGALAMQLDGNSYVANVYSLIDIDLYEGADQVQYQREVGNLAGALSRTIIRNCYVNAGGKNRLTASLDINFGTKSSAINAYNLYYSNKDDYDNSYSRKIAPNTLRNNSFHRILNADDAFDIDGFVTYGYYPHLIWPDVMPNQEYIPIPIVEDGNIDFLNAEDIEEIGDNEVQATLVFQNPGYETITGLSFTNISTRFDINKQENDNGKSKVVVVFHSPTKFVSKYDLTRITYVDANYMEHYRTYGGSARSVEIDMYKNIHNRSEFDEIKTQTSWNFRLQADIDFTNSPFYVPTFYGKIDGNGHTLKNFTTNSSYPTFIGTLNGGTLKNLFIDGFNQNSVFSSGYGGIIGIIKANSTLDNVHAKNVSVTDANSTTKRSYSYNGGLIGYAENSLINNSSIDKVHVYETNKDNFRNNGYYGGFIGYTASTIIQNSYATDVNVEIKTALKTNGIGGFIGRVGSGYIRDCYAEGVVDTNQSEVGGIVGYNSGYLERVISVVDVYSQQDTIGGIVGYSTNQYVYNTLSIGNVYSSKTATYENRTIGNKAAINSNFAWNEQLISGLNTNVSNGDILLTTEELQSATTYDSMIKLGKQFDLTNLVDNQGHNIIPKLKFLNTEKVIPNQKNVDYYVSDIHIKDINIRKTETDATIQIIIDNPNNYELEEMTIDGLTIRNVNKNETDEGETLYEIHVTPERFYDSYLIKSIKFKNGNKSVIINPSAKIKAPFYKDIGTFEDWQKIDSTIYENYRLVQDIDFTGKTNVKTRISVNRLEGTDGGHTISNITINATSGYVGLFDTVACNIDHVNFDNITINSTSNQDYTGIIRFLNGTMSDVNFTNINITSSGSNVGIIGSNSSIDIKRINLNTVTVKGVSYVGGLIGITRYFDIAHITAQHVTVNATGSYIGGVIGFMDGSLTYPTMFYFIADDMNVSGASEVGGVFGRGACSYSTVTNAHVTGTSMVGSFAGRTYFMYISDIYVKDSDVTATGSDIGGIIGYSYGISHVYGDNITVNATKATCTDVGGIAGDGSGYNFEYTGIKNSTITSLGDNVGGIRGYSNYMHDYCYVYNTKVTGRNNVGGILGYHAGSAVYVRRCMSDADVLATGDQAGGLVGKLNNINTDVNDNRIFIYDNILAGSKIESRGDNAGAISGSTQKYPFQAHFYSNYLHAYVKNDTGVNKYGFFLGNDDSSYSNASQLQSIKVFGGSTFNGSAVSNIANLPSNIVVAGLNDIKVQSFYTSLFNITGVSFTYNKLNSGFYPYINAYIRGEGSYVGEGVALFALPNESTVSPFSVNPGMFGMSMHTNSISTLPDVTVYASDVDKINVEFSKLTSNTQFTINGKKYDLDQLTYTLYYDFTKDFTIEISDNSNTKTYNIKADDLKNSSGVNGNSYYYINGNKVISNNNSSLENISNTNIHYRIMKLSDTNKTPVNIFDNKILFSNQNIYDIDKKKMIENSFENFSITSSKPLYRYKYGNNDIDTYYNYSIVNNEYISKQVFVKDEELEVIDSTLNNKKNNILIDNYNGDNYVIFLGTDGKLYSLKNNIVFPNNFKNAGIKSFSTDNHNKSNIIFVQYENGNHIVFNYRNGNTIDKSLDNDKDITNYFKSYFNSTPLNNKKINDYYESKKIVEKLEKNSISDVLGKNDDLEITNDKYTTTFNPVTNKYEIFKISNSVDNKSNLEEELVSPSVSNTIDNNPILYRYYVGKKKLNSNTFISIFVIVAVIVSGIVITTILLRNNLREEQ